MATQIITNPNLESARYMEIVHCAVKAVRRRDGQETNSIKKNHCGATAQFRHSFERVPDRSRLSAFAALCGCS